MMRPLSVLLLCLMSACSGAAESRAVSEAITAGNGLVFDPSRLDLGEVKEGEKVHVEVLLRNNGSGFAQVVRIETSCGCTTAEPETRMLAPGAFTPLQIEIDTFGKRGKSRKWIKVFDQNGRESTVWLTLHTRSNPHIAAGNRSIFDGKCGSCHFQPAIGLSRGREIYQAVCSMCHGVDAKGGYAPGLIPVDKAVLKRVVSQGTGTTHMPGFARAAGGPLDQKQLGALVQWVLSLDD